ncbi:MAG: hypothetical protein O2931_08375 [Planctomycetota bacterium]|nr:hypothetical protein [Planctomycetota bacterium]
MNGPVPTKTERDAALVATGIKRGWITRPANDVTTPSVSAINKTAAAQRNRELQVLRQRKFERKRRKAAAAVGERLL